MKNYKMKNSNLYFSLFIFHFSLNNLYEPNQRRGVVEGAVCSYRLLSLAIRSTHSWTWYCRCYT